MSAEDNREADTEAGTIGDKRGRGYGDTKARAGGGHGHWSGASCEIRNEDTMTL